MTTLPAEQTVEIPATKDEIVEEMLTIYSHLSRDQMNLLVNKCYPDMFELLDMIERKQSRKRSKEPKSGFSERRAQRAEEREIKRKEKEEKRARKAELKEA